MPHLSQKQAFKESLVLIAGSHMTVPASPQAKLYSPCPQWEHAVFSEIGPCKTSDPCWRLAHCSTADYRYTYGQFPQVKNCLAVTGTNICTIRKNVKLILPSFLGHTPLVLVSGSKMRLI